VRLTHVSAAYARVVDAEGWDGEDPGWGRALRGLSPTTIMFLQLRMRRSRDAPLVLLRTVLLSFVSSLVLFAVILSALPMGDRRWQVHNAIGIGVLIAVASLAEQAVVWRFMERPLPCGEGLVVAYRTRFFLRIAFANAGAMFAFVCSFLSNRWWLYLFGLAVGLIGLLRAAPTRAALERDQERLREQGCTDSLLAALMQPPSRPAR
jgi:hypothetical protein